MGRSSVNFLVIILGSYLVLTASLLIYLWRTKGDAADALDKARVAEHKVDVIDKKLSQKLLEVTEAWDKQTLASVKDMADSKDKIESLSKKLEWAEMKLNNMPRKLDYPAFPTKLHLTIDPIETKNKNYNRSFTLPVQVIDKRLDKKLTDTGIKKKVIKDIKNQLKELSQ